MKIRRQRGNAVLFSLIIMASAMTISLGMTSLVVGEVRSVSLVLPSEHAYYKAESYVEQALWQKKADPNYQFKPAENSDGVVTPPVGQQLAANYLCNTPPCFLTAPTDQATLLKQFYATTAPTQTDVSFPADVTRQYDIVTTPANGSGTLTVSNIVGQGSHGPGDIGYQGMEVSIIAYPVSSSPTSQFPIEAPTTPVFVDKIFIPDGESSRTIPINTALRNPIGEAYPSLDSSNIYRLRIKALGGDAEADVSAVSGGQALELRNPDFTVRAVAEDSNSRRGIEVLAPDAEQLSSIFDYVLFSDLDLDKTNAKVSPKSIVANVYRDNDGDCVRDANEPGVPNLLVTNRSGGVDQVQTTNDTGATSFIGLNQGQAYTVSTAVPSGYQTCSPPGNDQSVTFSGTATEVKQVTFLVRQIVASPSPGTSGTINGRDFNSCSYQSTGAYCLTDYATYPNSVYFFCGGDGNLSGACGGTNNAAAVWDYRFNGITAGTYSLTFNYYNYPNGINPTNPPAGYGGYRIGVEYRTSAGLIASQIVNLPIESTDASRDLHTFTVNSPALVEGDLLIKLTWDNDAYTNGDANFGLNWIRLAPAAP